MKNLIPLIISAIVLVVYFSISQPVLQEQSLSKQCTIPDDVNFIERRGHPAPNDGKPHYSIEEEFTIYHTVPIGSFEVDEISHSLILKPVPTLHGYVIMCDPLPILQKRFNTKIDGLMILVDNKETEYKIINNVLKINVDNNTRIEIIDSNLTKIQGKMAQEICAVIGGDCPEFYLGNFNRNGSVSINHMIYGRGGVNVQIEFLIQNQTLTYVKTIQNKD